MRGRIRGRRPSAVPRDDAGQDRCPPTYRPCPGTLLDAPVVWTPLSGAALVLGRTGSAPPPHPGPGGSAGASTWEIGPTRASCGSATSIFAPAGNPCRAIPQPPGPAENETGGHCPHPHGLPHVRCPKSAFAIRPHPQHARSASYWARQRREALQASTTDAGSPTPRHPQICSVQRLTLSALPEASPGRPAEAPGRIPHVDAPQGREVAVRASEVARVGARVRPPSPLRRMERPPPLHQGVRRCARPLPARPPEGSALPLTLPHARPLPTQAPDRLVAGVLVGLPPAGDHDGSVRPRRGG